MAFATILSVTTSQNASTTSHAVDMPATVSAGNTLVAIAGSNNAGGSWTPPAGWAQIDVFHQPVSTRRTARVFKKTANGTEGGTSPTFQSTNSVGSAWHVYRIDEDVDVEMLGQALEDSGDTSPNPGSASPSWGSDDATWIAFCVCGSDVSGYPSSYTNGSFTQAGSGSARLATARRQNATATENPGAFTQASSATWVAGVLAVRLAGASSAPTITDVTPSSFEPGETFTIDGANFSASGNTVELGSSATYASATKATQVINSEDEDEIECDAVRGALSYGTVYVFVKDEHGNVSAGFAVTLEEPPPSPPAPVDADIPTGHLGIEIFAPGDPDPLGAIASVVRMQTTEQVNGLGTWSAEVPTRLVNRSIVTHGCEVSLLREGEGEVFRGILDHISRSEHDASMTVLSGKSLAVELEWPSTYRGIQVVNQTMAATYAALLAGTGWNAFTTGTFENVTRRWDNVSRWAAILELAPMRAAFVREIPTSPRWLEIKQVPTASGIRLTNVPYVTPELAENTQVGIITGIESIVDDSQELYNRVVPEAKVDGDDVFDIAASSRNAPYTRQNFSGVAPTVVDLTASNGSVTRIHEGSPLVIEELQAYGERRVSIAVVHSLTGGITFEALRDGRLPATVMNVDATSHQGAAFADWPLAKGNVKWEFGHNLSATPTDFHAVALTFRDFRTDQVQFVPVNTNTSGSGTSVTSSESPGSDFENTLFVDVVMYEGGSTTITPNSSQTVIYNERVVPGGGFGSHIAIGVKEAVVGETNNFNWTIGASRPWIHLVFRINAAKIWYVEDQASIDAYGLRARILPLGGYGRINEENRTNAANTLYDRAVDFLIDHKDPLRELSDVKVARLGRGGWNVGDTMEVEYRSADGDIDETMVCVRRVADYDENGVRTWTLTLSNVKRFSRDLARLMADLVERVETAQHYQV